MKTAGASGGPIRQDLLLDPFLMARWLRNKNDTGCRKPAFDRMYCCSRITSNDEAIRSNRRRRHSKRLELYKRYRTVAGATENHRPACTGFEEAPLHSQRWAATLARDRRSARLPVTTASRRTGDKLRCRAAKRVSPIFAMSRSKRRHAGSTQLVGLKK
jgi:hypothetical protein